jgi:hypothetical protein
MLPIRSNGDGFRLCGDFAKAVLHYDTNNVFTNLLLKISTTSTSRLNQVILRKFDKPKPFHGGLVCIESSI